MALAAAGLLNGKMGGPPVSPYQPVGLWKESNSMSPSYKQSVGRALYRRSIYSVWKRTAPLPNMVAFDAPSREVCTARRQSTDTPIQALVLLNDVQFVEAARGVAQRMMLEGGPEPRDRVRFGFVQLAGREPSEKELALLMELFDEQRELFRQQPEHAQELLALGDAPVAKDVSQPELAAATVVAQTILNLDATVWKR